MNTRSRAVVWCAMLALTGQAAAQYGATGGQWPVYGAGSGNAKYSNLDLINESNLADLTVAWEWVSVDASIQDEYPDDPQIARATYFQCTPLMVDGVLYLSTSLGQAYSNQSARSAGTV